MLGFVRMPLHKGARRDDADEVVRFGWVNASYVYGLQIINAHMKRALGACTPFDSFRKATERDEDMFRADADLEWRGAV